MWLQGWDMLIEERSLLLGLVLPRAIPTSPSSPVKSTQGDPRSSQLSLLSLHSMPTAPRKKATNAAAQRDAGPRPSAGQWLAPDGRDLRAADLSAIAPSEVKWPC